MHFFFPHLKTSLLRMSNEWPRSRSHIGSCERYRRQKLIEIFDFLESFYPKKRKVISSAHQLFLDLRKGRFQYFAFWSYQKGFSTHMKCVWLGSTQSKNELRTNEVIWSRVKGRSYPLLVFNLHLHNCKKKSKDNDNRYTGPLDGEAFGLCHFFRCVLRMRTTFQELLRFMSSFFSVWYQRFNTDRRRLWNK